MKWFCVEIEIYENGYTPVVGISKGLKSGMLFTAYKEQCKEREGLTADLNGN